MTLYILLHFLCRPTFYKIFKKKSTQEFQSLPYSVALFSAMLMLYYASLKNDAFMLITINAVGCFIETIYLVIYMIYATKISRVLLSHPYFSFCYIYIDHLYNLKLRNLLVHLADLHLEATYLIQLGNMCNDHCIDVPVLSWR